MTEKKTGTIDSIAIRELISQGIPMKQKESEMKRSLSEEQCVESKRPNDEPISKDFSKVPRRERRKADEGDYESLFICRNTLKNRKTIYIARVARHAGGNSHVDEKQRCDHWYLCGEHYPSSP